jgi:hypothetical protein
MEVWRAASRMAHERTRGINICKSGARQAAWRMEEHMAEIYGSLRRAASRVAHRRTHVRNIGNEAPLESGPVHTWNQSCK